MRTELDLAKAISRGELPSPYKVPISNYWLLDLRISGTGFAYRDKNEAFVYRDPDDYLSDEALSMCAGLPVIFDHPDGGVNDDSKVIGSVFYPYAKGDESRGIAKIFDSEALLDIAESEGEEGKTFSTSCSFVTGTKKITVNDTQVSQDLPPQSCNHIAILRDGAMGVWDKLDPERAKTAITINLPTNRSPEMDTPEQAPAAGSESPELINVLKQMASGFANLEAKLDKIIAPAAPAAPVAAPEPKNDAVVTDPEPKATEDQTPHVETEEQQATEDAELAELAARVQNLEQGMVKDDSEMEESAMLNQDSMNLAAIFGQRAEMQAPVESAKQFKRRLLKKHLGIADELKVAHDWKGIDADRIDDSMLDIAYRQVKKALTGITPQPTEEQPFVAFKKPGVNGLADQTHFKFGNKADYFKTFQGA